MKNKWYDKTIHPEEYKDIIVRDAEGEEYDNHCWNGHCYYEYVENPDGSCDGYRSDVDIVSWRYKEKG